MAPISVKASIFFKCPECNGVSRTIQTSRRRSFRMTSAALEIKVSVTPVAISARVFTEHGAMIIPIVLNEPEASDAPPQDEGRSLNESRETPLQHEGVNPSTEEVEDHPEVEEGEAVEEEDPAKKRKEFGKIMTDFLNDIKTTFPELSNKIKVLEEDED